MVAVINGSGLGLHSSLLSTRSNTGPNGQSQSGEQVSINTATGNLVIQSRDEALSSVGLDLSLIRTYNSQGLMNDDNGDNWQLGVHAKVYGLTGTVNTAGSTVRKVFGDGNDVVYTYNAALTKYVSSNGEGAHDTLSFNSTTGKWTWTDGSARNTETYSATG